jgi:organic radical activating enzyme
VDTAYYATQFGYAKGDDNNVRALLEQMHDISNRRAAMVSVLVAVRSADDPEPLIAMGRVVGQIAREPTGSNGFGFDPVMWIPEFGQTFAQLPTEVKNANSHRGRSAKAMSALIREHWMAHGRAMFEVLRAPGAWAAECSAPWSCLSQRLRLFNPPNLRWQARSRGFPPPALRAPPFTCAEHSATQAPGGGMIPIKPANTTQDAAVVHDVTHYMRPGTLQLAALPPLSLYVHLPWCLKKCPYCDFNSHEKPGDALPELRYVDAVIADLEAALPLIWGRTIHSIFIGGGTPSLFAPATIDRLLGDIRARLSMEANCEITMEANPGTFEKDRFRAYRQAGVTRLSIGVQSFNDAHLKALGRVHDRAQALAAVEEAARSFDTFNLDIMYALPGQSLEQAGARHGHCAAVCAAAHLHLPPDD